jgi:hypothetical protein
VPLDLDSLCQKNPSITSRKRNVQPEDAFEDTDLKTRFEIAKFKTWLQGLRSSLLFEIDTTNGCLTSSSFR